MAKKAATNRVHKIAKKLGVDSKDIIAKCKSEGIPNIKSYQSAVSAGLEATIMEWFSDGDKKTTAVETAEKIDVKKVKAKAKKKTKKKTTKKTTKKKTKSAGSKEKPNEDDSEKIIPQGRRIKTPTKAKMSGPKVIRIEEPEPEPKPRQPKRRPSPQGPQGGSGVRPPQQMPPQQDTGKGSRRNKRRDSTQTRQPERGSRNQGQQQDRSDSNWRKQDLLERENRLRRSGGFFRQARRDSQKRSDNKPVVRAKTLKQTGGKVTVSEPISIKELSASTGIKANEILNKLVLAGVMATVNDNIETEQAIEIMMEWGIELEIEEQRSEEEKIVESFTTREVVDEKPRSPDVTILGHVDHGKTSLLDKIRSANVADGEAGGITQATSAFSVPVKTGVSERVITFIDNPGRAAFTEMRARGAKVTDIVVLVVAADDGVMPQTIESINHAKSAGVPIVVALNKIDKQQATDENIQRILGQLAEHDLNSVEWGGTTEVVRTSAIEDIGIQDLLEILA